MRRKFFVTLRPENVIDLIMIDSNVKQESSAIVEGLLAVRTSVLVVTEVFKVLLEDADEVRAVVILEEDHS